MVDIDALCKDVVENKALLRELMIKFDVLLEILKTEGVISGMDVEKEFEEAVKNLHSTQGD